MSDVVDPLLGQHLAVRQAAPAVLLDQLVSKIEVAGLDCPLGRREQGRARWTQDDQRIGGGVEVGFVRAFPSIFDSNSTTLITCGILWWLGQREDPVN